MARKNRQNTRKRNGCARRNTRKNRRGGGWGFTGPSSIPGVPGTVSNPQVFTAIGDCRAAEPGYWIPQSGYSKYETGLPGMNGGKRSGPKRSRRNRKNRKSMKGGRYTFDLSQDSVNGVSPNAAAWWAGTYPPVQRIACEGSTPNPLNPGPHTPSTQPLPVATSALGLNPQSGGAQNMAPATVGVGDVDSMYYYAPTAGYDNKPSTWVDSVGAPVQLQIPYAARAMNPACLTTGHPPALTGALQAGGGVLNTLGSGVQTVTGAVTGATTGLLGASGNFIGDITGTMAQSAKALTTVPADISQGVVEMKNTMKGGANPAAALTGAVTGAASAVTGATGALLSGATEATASGAKGLYNVSTGLGSNALQAVRGAVQMGGGNGNNGAIATEQVSMNLPVPTNAGRKNLNATVTVTAAGNNKKGALNTATEAITGAFSGIGNALGLTGNNGASSLQMGGRKRNNRKNSRKNTRKASRKNRKANRKNRKNTRRA